MPAYDEQEYTKSFDIKIWKRLGPYLRPRRRAFALLIAMNLPIAMVDAALPLFQRYAVANFIETGSIAGLWPFGLVYFAVILLQAAAVMGFGNVSMGIEMYLGRDLRRRLFTHLQELSFSFYNVTPVGYLISRVMNDTNRIAGMLAWNLADMLWALCYLVFVFVSMLLLNWKLALVVILVVPAVALLTGYFQNRILHWNRRVRKLSSRITGAFNEGITGAKTSKTLVIEDSNDSEFRSLTGQARDAGVKAAKLSAVYIPLVLFCSTLAVAIVLYSGGHMSLDGVLGLSTLSAFVTYAVGIFEPVQILAEDLAEFISLQANIERVTGLLDTEPNVRDSQAVIEKYGDAFHPKRENWEPIRGDIEFRDVTFRYPDGGEDVLSHFDLKIPAGTPVAIVGETGAGKSTLVNLAGRFFEPTEGQILIDGVDYRERSQLWLHSAIGYVLQSPHLFSGSLRENIRYGRLDATDEEVEAAARAVSADIVAEKLENGWDSDVGEGGDKLSTGEKQLVSFARAVLADPRIFVLDEATSSIDTQTEQLIQDAIEHILRDRTSFLIAHRLSTIRRADLILVVRDGRIVEQGTHRELLSRRGYYHELYSRQFAEENSARVLRAE